MALAQAGVGLAVRHGTPPRWLTPTPARARALLAAGLATCVVAALLAGAPARISHAWQDFKHTGATAALHDDSIARFGTVSGNGRYTYWKVAIDATSGHLLAGNGGGTFQLLWDPRAPYYSPVVNAHSLYVETLAETGVVGLALLGSFFLLLLGAAVMLCRRSRYEARVRAAGLTGALIAFTVGAAADWLWQVPALPAAFLLLSAALLAPARAPAPTRAPLPLRLGAIAVAIASLLCRRGPTRDRQHGARKPGGGVERRYGRRSRRRARRRACLEPDAASPRIQLALVLELEGDVPGALAAAQAAAANEPDNWSTWLIVSRLEAEAGHPDASVAAYLRSRSLNPQSPLFRQ